MGRGLVSAWLLGEGIVIWRIVHRDKRMPPPGELLGITGLFALLAAAAEYRRIAGLVTALAWGLDIAALLNVLPAGLGGQIQQAQQAEAKAEGVNLGGTGAPPVTAV